MRSLIILIIFVSFISLIKVVNKNETKKYESKKEVQLLFSKIYKHRFDTL